MTIAEIKNHFENQISDIYTPSEAEELFYIFATHQLTISKIEVRRLFNNELNTNDLSNFQKIIQGLKTGKPYQYILGNAEFYGKTFFVDESVLIPRPETEELLELAIDKIKKSVFQDQKFKVLDIGTGSGVIPIILKKQFPNAEVTSMDISKKAIKVAEKNAHFHEVEIDFISADYLNYQLDEKFDIIISNPPYIGKNEFTEIEDTVKGFEPNIALFSPSADALIFYKKIAKDAEQNLSKNGMVFVEINQKLGKETLALFEHFSQKELIQDISQNDRIVWAKKG